MIDFKVMCYNIHKGKSFFTRQRVVNEIKEVIHKVNADIIFLQEVRDYHCQDFKIYSQNQLDFLSDSKYTTEYGQNCTYKKGHHGNAILTRFPILETKNYDLSVSRFEKRGILYNKLLVGQQELYTFCTHLNLRKPDRKKQVLLIEEFIKSIVPNEKSNILLLGDFNDFDNSIASHFKKNHFHIIEGHKTYPNFLPVLSPDKIFSKNLEIKNAYVIKGNAMLKLSDHLPIISEMKCQ